MRSVSFLVAAVIVIASSNQLQAQESSFQPSDFSTAVSSVTEATPAILGQQSVDTELGHGNEIFDVAATSETVNLPDVTTYSAPNFAGSNDVSFSPATSTARRRRRDQGIGDYFRQASLDAPSQGITLSFLGGGAFVGLFDEFGRDVGENLRVGETLGFSIGRRFSSTLRTDFELSWRDADMFGVVRDSSNAAVVGYETELKHFSGMVNFYYDFDRVGGRLLTPYIGIGLGASQQEVTIDFDDTLGDDLSDRETRFALQGIIGVSAIVSPRNALFVETRGFSTFEFDRSNVFNETLFGWRRTF